MKIGVGGGILLAVLLAITLVGTFAVPEPTLFVSSFVGAVALIPISIWLAFFHGKRLDSKPAEIAFGCFFLCWGISVFLWSAVVSTAFVWYLGILAGILASLVNFYLFVLGDTLSRR